MDLHYGSQGGSYGLVSQPIVTTYLAIAIIYVSTVFGNQCIASLWNGEPRKTRTGCKAANARVKGGSMLDGKEIHACNTTERSRSLLSRGLIYH